MSRILGIAICLAMATFAMGQSSGNPFDLKYRPAKPKPPVVSNSTTVSPDTTHKPVSTGQITKPLPVIKDSTQGTPNQGAGNTNQQSSNSNPFEKGVSRDSNKSTAIASPDTVASKKAAEKILPPALQKSASRGFQLFFLLLSLLFLIFIVNVERSFVRDLWRVISNENYSYLHHRNQRNTMRQILLVMGYAIFIFQGGLFMYHALRIFNYRGTLMDNIWITTLLILVIYLVRHISIRYLRWLFNKDKEMTLFGFDISIFNTMVGLVLLPINVLMIFGPESMHKPLIIIGIMVFIAAYLMRQLRWLLAARQLIGNSLFLFFIYLCAVEMLPLWAVSKLFW